MVPQRGGSVAGVAVPHRSLIALHGALSAPPARGCARKPAVSLPGLAAGGLTNREVAARSFLAVKTVEANLARVYRKLGIRSRAELGASLASE